MLHRIMRGGFRTTENGGQEGWIRVEVSPVMTGESVGWRSKDFRQCATVAVRDVVVDELGGTSQGNERSVAFYGTIGGSAVTGELYASGNKIGALNLLEAPLDVETARVALPPKDFGTQYPYPAPN